MSPTLLPPAPAKRQCPRHCPDLDAQRTDQGPHGEGAQGETACAGGQRVADGWHLRRPDGRRGRRLAGGRYGRSASGVSVIRASPKSLLLLE
jgi:hypothetical protein